MSDNIEIQTVVNPYYLLNDGKVYSKDKKDFVTKDTDTDYKAFLEQGNSPLSIGENGYTYEQLINTVLKFYGWEIGDCLLSLEELKNRKLNEVEEISAMFEENLNKDMYFTSSLEFKCNGDRRTRSNIEDLIELFDSQASGEPKTIDYRDYDNQTRKLTKEQLNILLKEHITNGLDLYKQKWLLLSQIKTAKTVEDLKNIKIKFSMSDFSSTSQKLNNLF